MINLETGTVENNEHSEKILKWDVWFHTPKGLTDSLDKAIQICQECDWPTNVIRPVPVAVGRLTYEVA